MMFQSTDFITSVQKKSIENVEGIVVVTQVLNDVICPYIVCIVQVDGKRY